jgi:16S rRNA (cytidine1402-2'-O)-methyltransferase
MLILIATPIGNREDLSHRAIDALRTADLILCEDTRHSGRLLKHYDIHSPLKSYHKFNEAKQEEELLALISEGQKIALISDAGTPGINDPGQRLVARCRQDKLPVTAIPGACAAILALTLSGLPSDRFQFIGFLDKKPDSLRRQVAETLHFPGTTIAYESPHRIQKTLSLISEIAPRADLAIARELTKRYEEVDIGPAEELSMRWKERTVKGEIVLLFGPYSVPWENEPPAVQIREVEEILGLKSKDAIKLISELRGIPKRDLYKKNT